jgi:hypothetical protein
LGFLLADVYICLIELEKIVESNPDVDEIIKTLEQEFEKQKEDSRFRRGRSEGISSLITFE